MYTSYSHYLRLARSVIRLQTSLTFNTHEYVYISVYIDIHDLARLLALGINLRRVSVKYSIIILEIASFGTIVWMIQCTDIVCPHNRSQRKRVMSSLLLESLMYAL